MSDTMFTPSNSPGRSWRRKQSVSCSQTDINRGSVSPSNVSQLSVDSGVGIEEAGLEVVKNQEISKEDTIDSDDNPPIYENFQFLFPESICRRSIENISGVLSITCDSLPSPPPPEQFSDRSGLVSTDTLEQGAQDREHLQEHEGRGEHVARSRTKHDDDKNCIEDENIYEDIDTGQNLIENYPRINIQTLRKNKVGNQTLKQIKGNIF